MRSANRSIGNCPIPIQGISICDYSQYQPFRQQLKHRYTHTHACIHTYIHSGDGGILVGIQYSQSSMRYEGSQSSDECANTHESECDCRQPLNTLPPHTTVLPTPPHSGVTLIYDNGRESCVLAHAYTCMYIYMYIEGI